MRWSLHFRKGGERVRLGVGKASRRCVAQFWPLGGDGVLRGGR
jgi:hypothetical protein